MVHSRNMAFSGYSGNAGLGVKPVANVDMMDRKNIGEVQSTRHIGDVAILRYYQGRFHPVQNSCLH